MNQEQQNLLDTLATYKQESEERYEIVTDLLERAKKAHYVFSGLCFELINYARTKDDDELTKILLFHAEQWGNFEDIKLPE
jgi:predicted small metal-binding protein